MEKSFHSDPTSIAEEIERRWFGPRMKHALRLVLQGESYRRAAELAGLKSHQDVARVAASIPGFQELHLRAWRASWGKEFPNVWRQHVKHLDEAA
jgi:hypothetical protein